MVGSVVGGGGCREQRPPLLLPFNPCRLLRRRGRLTLDVASPLFRLSSMPTLPPASGPSMKTPPAKQDYRRRIDQLICLAITCHLNMDWNIKELRQ